MLNFLIAVSLATNNNMNFDFDYDQVAHGNFVTYTWLFAAVGGALIAILGILIPIISSYSAKKVNKELCEKIHQENDKSIAEIKSEISQICVTSEKNHDALIRIETLLNAKIKLDAALLRPDTKIFGDIK